MSCKLLAGLCLLGAILTSCAGEAIVSLDPVPLYVDEGVQFNVTVRKAGENSAPFYVVVLIANATASNDFAGTSQVVEFDQGSGPVVKHATFTPFDDHIPEKEEQFRVELRAQAPRNIAKVVEPSSGTVVIRASDDAYGQFRFLQTDPVTVTESPSGPTPVVFTVQRDGGTFDNVTVNYQVFAEDGSEDVADDISPAQGSILFRAGEKNLLLTLYVQPDDLPENTETFRVVLNSASGGASINPAANKTEVPIIISANDAPLRFAQSTFAVDELGGTHDIEIDVLRGLEMDGVTPTGPVQGGASVLLSVIAGSAHEGLDYIARNQSLTFSGGVMRQKFRVTILKDDIPENAENFKVMLSHPGGDAVIAEPSKMDVIIKANDDHNGVLSFLSPVTGKSPALTVSEDSAPSVELTVLRGGGSFGTVTVQWEVIRTDNDNDPVSADMNPTGGRLTFYEGEKEKVIRFSVNQDSQPEPAEHFLVRLLPGSVTGGARLQNPSETSLFVLDSDDAHGLVEFGPNSLQTLNTAATVRHLSLLLVRGGGSFGNISVDFVADYYPDHNTDKTESGVLGTFACSGCHAASPIVLADGQTSTIFTIPIMDTAFLRVGGRFDVTLSRASRVPPVPGSLSPRIGHKDRASIPVPAALANGEIGFTSVETIYVNEPDDKPLMVPLEVSREGLAGDAYVVWRSHSSQDKDGRSKSKDNGDRNGTVLIKSGSNMGYINIKIMLDNVPETDEEITVNLISVQPANQKLRENARQVKVVVRENDAPGGSFQFSPAMNLSYLLEEDGPALEVAVERSGGMLVKREVQIFISPSSDQKNEADEEFYGGTNVLKFEAGERFKTATVVAVPDGIPELDEEYVLRLISYGEKVSDIGPKSAINITISKNDDPYGMFHFDASALRHTIGESKGNNTIHAEFTVMRDRGKFSPVTLKWHVLPKGNTDVTPLNGTVSFQDGQSAATMLLSSAPDEIPEEDENFTVVLEEPDASMEYRLTAPTSAVLTVKKNDDPVFFADPVNKFAEEPGVVQFTVRRNGSIEHPASIRYRTIPGTAIANQDYMAIDGDLLVFPAGVYERAISVVVRDDEEPENDEIFYIELFGAEGDVVAYMPKANATVMILANDDANGVFRFVPPLIITATEGETLKFGIQRFAGNFGAAQLWWHIVENGTNNEIPRETDFRPVSGFVRFLDQEVEKHFSVDVLADGTPEYDEYFDVKLHNVTGYGPSGQEGRLADEHLRVTVKVFGNDDPYGIFMFDPDTRDQYIAEDFYPGSEDSTVTNLTVVRLQGAYSTVQVLWEVFSDAIAGDLPAAKDLLFLGDYPETVTERPDMRRPLTGTKVLQFSGSQGDYVTISQQYQPLISDIETGFSVSTWIQPVAPQDGYIFAKTSDDGAKHYYTLHLEADTIQFKVTFGYSLMNSKQDGLTHRTLYWSERKNLCDGKWHQILIMLARGEAEFYLNGYFVGRKLTGTTRVIDESGTLLVGGIVPGDVSTYEGLMQDVRVYNRRLDPGEIEELSRAPARKDVKPVSGYLTFLPGVASHMLQLESVQDNEDEGNEVFAVKLLSARGGARITRDDGIGKVTVLKSDNANGLFGFEGDCTPSLAQSEGVDVVCTVQRSFGDEGVVTVHWTVMQWNETAGTYFNGSDFSETSGVLEFLPGERTQRLNLRVVDDAVPETVEVFHVRLVEATSDDGVAGTTNMSGASIDPRSSYSTVTVEANDFPYGLLQFMAGNASRVVGGLIVPATESQQIRTTEEIATLPITIERAQGLLGEISVEWRTVDGTAVSSGKVPPDFQRSSSSAVFQPGVQYRTINITILDNDLPEGEKEFQVELLNPTGGAQIGVGSTIKVIIASSDDAYGMFQFADTSLSVQGQELTDIGSTPIHLTVHRLGGTIGNATVYWMVLSDPDHDILNTNGVVFFSQGQQSADIEIQIAGDTIPELDEAFLVKLDSVTRGRLGDNAKVISSLTVLANDDPYGVFSIDQTARPILVEEASKDVDMKVLRHGGDMGMVMVNYTTLKPTDFFPYLPLVVGRAGELDFMPAKGTVVFQPNQTNATFRITILDDTLPEDRESLFVVLSSVTFLPANHSAPVPNSPRLGATDLSYGEIIILPNDHANGVLELDKRSVTVSEEMGGHGIVKVIRKGGSFGQVSVKFLVTQGNATQGLDYSVASSEVVFYSGDTEKEVPIVIINDVAPELAETFTITLTNQTTGGAVVGSVRETEVVIDESDDPRGAFSFESVSGMSEEPEAGTTVSIPITVIRTGGTLGVVGVTWTAFFTGGASKADINPTSGTVYFVTNEARQTFNVSILPDDIPEGPEVVEIRLMEANNDARIERYANVYTLTIMANDNPHGAVEFAKPSYLVEELETTDPQDIELHRIGGTYGQLKVYYSTKQMDLADLVKRHGKREVDYFSVERGYPPNGSANVVDVGRTPKPLQACALICLIEKTCIMFEHKADSHLCQWYITPPESGYGQKAQLYVKDKFKTTQLYSAQALSDIDYRSAQNHFIYINESETRASIPVHVIPDDLPELDELFTILLSHVELVGGDSTAGFPNKPVIGEIAEATVTIAANDDANGIFHIYSNDPRATDAGSRVYVEERSNFAVELVIERGGGNIGEVTVEWAVNKSLTTATRNVDYVADGAILNFKPGENQRVITIGIKDDGEPEMDEYIVVEVSNPGGGAAIADQNQVTVVIKANDQVAGLLGLSKHSLIAREGDVMKVNITRTLPALGNVTVYWLIEGLSGVHPASTFKQHQGHAWFQKGATWKEVTLEVLRDDTPEEKEEYELLLFNATTEGIRDSGSANFDEQADRTSITIDASNYPHGVVSFSPSSQAVRLNEAEQNKSIILTVQRKFGAIGAVRVYFEVVNGSLSTLSEDLMLAIPWQDFIPYQGYIDLASGQQSNTIKVEVLDDDIPEVDEVFLVNLTSVELLSRFATSMQPSLDPQSSTAQITISANDGTQGMVHFTAESINLNVDESVGNVTLHIYRSQGHFGDVSVFYYSQSVPPEGAKADDDFIVAAQELRFAAGEGAKDIQVQIIDDDIAEPSETFEIILASASNGLQLGEPHKATLTILPNDNAAGTVNFESSDNIYIREPSSGNPGGSVVDVRVIRGPGIYGNIRVPFLITVVNGSDQEGDLDPMNGYITFADRESVAVLQIRAIQDNVPEKEELFRLELFKPEGGGQLGTMANRYIYIAENDAPHGLIEIYPHNVRNKFIVSVQEDSGTVYVDVVRSRGVLGRVTAVVMTEQVSATGEEGSMLILPMIQTLPMITSLRVHSFFAHNYLYVLTLSSMARGEPRTRLPGSALLPGIRSYGNETGSIMWRWQGTFIPAQTIETDGAMSATTFSLAGKLYLAIANHGGMGDVEVISMLYHIMQNGTLSVVQDIASKGTTAIRYFSSDEKHFLVVANSQDNYGNTLISSEVLQWNRDMQKFDPVPIQFIPCKAASDATIFTTYGDLYLVITNFYDSQWNLFEIDSMVYKWVPERNQFDVHQRIPTKGAISVTYFVIAGQGHLLIGNSRDDSDVTQLNSTVYRFKSSTKLFMPIQYIPTHGVQTVHSFTTYETVFVVLACTQSNSTIWAWNNANAVFEHAVNSRPAHDLFPVAIGSGIQQSHLLVESGVGKLPNVYLLASITTTSDFVPRRETVTFEPGQSKVTVGVGIVDDTRPEGDEQFIIRITDPGGGSVVGPQNRITVTVLSNDDAHGVVEFSEDSLDVKVEERTVPNQVTLTVVRSKGTSGHISVQWMTTGEHDGIEDIYPIGGKVDFADGQDKTTITITIAPDPRPELDEVTLVTLVDVSVPGSPDKRTRIGKNNVARITVMANDSPHGVVSWEKTRANFDEPLGQGSKVSLKVIREQGTMGTIVISYSTARALNQPDSAQAISGQDYIATQGSISMEVGMGEADVDLFLLPDDLPEGDEVFLVNITGVSLAGGVSVGGAVPSVKRPDDETMAVSINENDNARGIIQFNVTRTPLGVVEVYEGIGSVRLGLSRTKGAYRKVSVSWQAIPDSASAADFKPLSGEVIFGHQQRHATIDIQIVDDPLPEYHESFSVQLLEAKGGAELGTDRYVVINILKNDSPNGLFSFTDTQKSVLESETFGDPNGRVRFDVVRTQGAQGRVHVTWKLSSDAVFDIQPMQGNLTFLEGETVKTIFLETIPDDYLEGEEQYTISLVAADNNADISPNLGDAMLVIQSDPGASGVITILPEYRYVSIGEPSEDYDGTTEVVINRGVGKFGAVSVTWQLTPRDAEFAQTSGTITFRDMQENATIVLQAVDDMKPELRHDYVLALVSVSGGAVISTRPGMNTATVAMAASDYPHGLFHFTEPQVVRVSEDAPQLSLPVVRSLGSAGQVLVQYSTVAGTAVSDRDFRQIAGSLTFGPGDDRQNILIAIRQDLEPEGDEHFNVSLASVRLISPASNDYVKGSHGYSLDMSPDLGPLVNKTVIIEKNDNAEGTIEFGPSAVNFLVKEESSMAYVPVVRTRGTFGIVSASYTSRPITALSNGIDYLLPDGEVVFPEGVGLATINVTIVDDSAREVDEAFEIMLTRVHGGAKLGDLRVATVTITQSDFPYGKIGFTGSTAITIPNPDSARTLDFTIQRTEGLTGRQTVRWHLLGPNGDWPTDSTDDISYRNSIPRGVVTFNDGDMGSENIALVVNPYRGPEIEKVYNLVIDDIRGRPGSAEVSPTAGNVTLKILKHGDPNGIVKFVGSALQSVVLDEPSRDAPPLMLTFPISRSEGTVGSIEVHWEVEGPKDAVADIEPYSGVAVIPDSERNGQIVVRVLPENEPELTENFMVVLSGVKGGAEIARSDNSSSFTIKANDDPHGVFSISPDSQTVIVTHEMNRQVQLNITREGGAYGPVRVAYDINYEQGEDGVRYVPTSGSVSFRDGQNQAAEHIDVAPGVRLDLDSYFIVTLTAVTYLGSHQALPPRLNQGSTSARIYIPQEAANSQVGFLHNVVTVNEVTNEARFTIYRWGSYGEVEITWLSGLPKNMMPGGFLPGIISPQSDQVTLYNGESSRNVSAMLLPKDSVAELFAAQIVSVNARTGGTATVKLDMNTVKVDPHGVIQFALPSRILSASESFGEVKLDIMRAYGSEGKVRLSYQTWALTAMPDRDYTSVVNGALVMDSAVTSATIVINIISDTEPETNEEFFVNITGVEILPTVLTRGVSPRLSDLYSVALVTILGSNDPYGIISFRTPDISVRESNDGSTRKALLQIERTGGSHGKVAVTVRTIGGGELWEKSITPQPGNSTDNIAQALAAITGPRATAGDQFDYLPLTQTVTFEEGEILQTVNVIILDDPFPEPDEMFFVYLSGPTGGARIATGSQDGWKKGYAVVTIEANDLWNGRIGFAASSNKTLLDEDGAGVVTLNLTRYNAFFGRATVNWRASYGVEQDIVRDSRLSGELLSTAGQAVCEPGQQTCSFTIGTKQDKKPEKAWWFLVVLDAVGEGAELDRQRQYANITVMENDYPFGLVQFNAVSRFVTVSDDVRRVTLGVERTHGDERGFQVGYTTQRTYDVQHVAGVSVYPALSGADFTAASGVLTFAPGEQLISFPIYLTPERASANPLPKIFQVRLTNPTDGAELNKIYAVANITIVGGAENSRLWAIRAQMAGNLGDDLITRLLDEVGVELQRTLPSTGLSLVEDIIESVLTEGLDRPLPFGARRNLFNIFCLLMDPTRHDTRGHYELAALYEKFAYTMLTGQNCDGVWKQLSVYTDCPHTRITAYRQLSQNIPGHTFTATNGDSLRLPEDYQYSTDTSVCKDLHFIEYSSQQWFPIERDVKPIVDSRILSVGIRDEPSRYVSSPVLYTIYTNAGLDGRCVYFSESAVRWTGSESGGLCEVIESNSRHVQCACRHLSSYGVLPSGEATTSVPVPAAEPQPRYGAMFNIWFFVSCFVAMLGLFSAIFAHHVCSIYSRFTASLLMHMCFACLATEVVYVINAYMSADILADKANNSCISMGIFLHYFFVAQFTWMVAQAFNLWKTLVMNDEHTERKYVLFFLIGWGTPAVIVAIFYAVAFNLYRYVFSMDPTYIYGDVHQNHNICFIMNVYSALASVIAPWLLLLVYVVAVFVQAYQVLPQWHSYDDIYRGRYNYHEVRAMLIFWGLIVVTWIWGSLHLAYGYLWLLVLFCIFNIVMGVYALVVYAALRHPCLPCFRPVKEGSYGVASHPPTISASVKPPPVHEVPWESVMQQTTPKSTMQVKRTPAPPNNVFILPPNMNAEENETSDFDDLIFALKTGGQFLPERADTLKKNRMETHVKPDTRSDMYGGARRIPIADTHL